MVRADGTFEFVNRAWLVTLGYDQNEVAKLNVKDIVHPTSYKHYEKILEIASKGGESVTEEVVFVTKNGDPVYLDGTLSAFIENGENIGAYGFYHNITEKHTADETIKEAQKKIEFFVDLITHDLTNINQEILTLFELILQTFDVPPELKKLLEEGIHEVERSSQLILNVKKLHIIETKKPVMKIRDLGEALHEAAERVRDTFSNKELVLSTNIEKGKYFVLADEFLDDIFYALLHNSMKFDPKQQVKVEVEIEEIKFTPFLRIQVKDHGPGIPDEDKEEIFERIVDRRDTILGLGLGLTLVKKIVENYGGQIYIEDRVEGDHTKGANFILLIRKAEQQNKEEESS